MYFEGEESFVFIFDISSWRKIIMWSTSVLIMMLQNAFGNVLLKTTPFSGDSHSFFTAYYRLV